MTADGSLLQSLRVHHWCGSHPLACSWLSSSAFPPCFLCPLFKAGSWVDFCCFGGFFTQVSQALIFRWSVRSGPFHHWYFGFYLPSHRLLLFVPLLLLLLRVVLAVPFLSPASGLHPEGRRFGSHPNAHRPYVGVPNPRPCFCDAASPPVCSPPHSAVATVKLSSSTLPAPLSPSAVPVHILLSQPLRCARIRRCRFLSHSPLCLGLLSHMLRGLLFCFLTFHFFLYLVSFPLPNLPTALSNPVSRTSMESSVWGRAHSRANWGQLWHGHLGPS